MNYILASVTIEVLLTLRLFGSFRNEMCTYVHPITFMLHVLCAHMIQLNLVAFFNQQKLFQHIQLFVPIPTEFLPVTFCVSFICIYKIWKFSFCTCVIMTKHKRSIHQNIIFYTAQFFYIQYFYMVKYCYFMLVILLYIMYIYIILKM